MAVTTAAHSLDAGVASSGQGRFWYGTLPRHGQEVHVLVHTAAASNETVHMAATCPQIIEPEAMPTGRVKVDAKALDQGLKADGRIARYGLCFDTGRADIKPGSEDRLAETAKLLQAQPALRVRIVGRTDNQGALGSNTTLSRQRATAVVGAVSGGREIDSKRMAGRGVGRLARPASNASDAGRARNRRVGLVVQ